MLKCELTSQVLEAYKYQQFVTKPYIMRCNDTLSALSQSFIQPSFIILVHHIDFSIHSNSAFHIEYIS